MISAVRGGRAAWTALRWALSASRIGASSAVEGGGGGSDGRAAGVELDVAWSADAFGVTPTKKEFDEI
jgi:hypothetical protein